MKKTKKETLITSFALFSMFFGAGNLIFPPFLGKNAADTWHWVAFGFFITAVFIPILGILAHARLQGTMYDFGKKVSPTFSFIYCFVVYVISVALPAPRTASVTHEMAIQPYFETDSLFTSSIYFALVLAFVMNRSKILTLIGRFLTPLIIVILLSIICIGIFSSNTISTPTIFNTPFVSGLFEGYQTFDAIGAVVIGGVLVISMNFNKNTSFQEKKELITTSGLIAGLGLLIIYAGLIYNGAIFGSTFPKEASRSEILSSLSSQTLGNIGTTLLSVLVALACFTTAVGIITGTSDYFKSLFNNSEKAYTITAIIGCVLGIVIGQFNVQFIVDIAFPALMFIYPITIILILLNLLPTKLATPTMFKAVVLVTFVFSIPDFLQFFIDKESLVRIQNIIPFSKDNLGWVLPALLTFLVIRFSSKKEA
ncbi:branched-chain amino acid transport system II carrier protein [Tenacibaculum sp. SZ-18]|uniref:branched-chain amino acid transport system II carrier protein n=1 Tax=Tenacibaculum sp. SZ-18 TaxID=754423 RepID=UPI000C2D0C59|nr:branched-chain amino acid transport system II carrier protein [Tenacibaculum sp. SZ-18]AUC16473.1 branched-chain amino acid transport system II carrier protein [Tenacibaculum sp. SZ-18]